MNNNSNDNNPRTSKLQKKNIWFNPPFSKIVAKKTGRYFLNLIDQYLP